MAKEPGNQSLIMAAALTALMGVVHGDSGIASSADKVKAAELLLAVVGDGSPEVQALIRDLDPVYLGGNTPRKAAE